MQWKSGYDNISNNSVTLYIKTTLTTRIEPIKLTYRILHKSELAIKSQFEICPLLDVV